MIKTFNIYDKNFQQRGYKGNTPKYNKGYIYIYIFCHLTYSVMKS